MKSPGDQTGAGVLMTAAAVSPHGRAYAALRQNRILEP